MVSTFLGKSLVLEKVEVIPSLAQAESTLKLTPGFVQKISKQYGKETNPYFDKTYDMIDNNLGLINELPRKSR